MNFNIVQIFVLITTIHIFLLKKKNENIFILRGIIVILFLTELISILLQLLNTNLNLLYSLSFTFHNLLWLLLISKYFNNLKVRNVLLILFSLFCVINFIFIEGRHNLNFNIFIVGAMLYLILYIYFNSLNIKNEKLSFFQSNNFLLISCPVLFFIGLSMLFGFKSHDLNSIKLYKNFNLYNFFIHFVNIIYYSLLNLYIFKEKKQYE